jgi:Cu/Ag efflux protein CusF
MPKPAKRGQTQEMFSKHCFTPMFFSRRRLVLKHMACFAARRKISCTFRRNCPHLQSFWNHIPRWSVLFVTSSIGLGDNVRERLRPLFLPEPYTRISRRKSRLIRGRRAVVFCLFAFAALATLPIASAEEDAVHLVSGVVKHVDRGAKKVVVKADDGTEHSIKWTGKTTWEGTKDAGKGIKDGSQVTVKYTEKAGEKTAVGIKDAGKDIGKAAQ